MTSFQDINTGYNSVFQIGKLSLGLVSPIESYAQREKPKLQKQTEIILLAEKLGFKALWLRDIPFDIPAFGDVGQMYDPFTYLGYIAGHTQNIALGVASIALPLHDPVHVAKSAHTIDRLSSGRMILGVASGDRKSEYPAMNKDHKIRGEIFRESFEYLRAAQRSFPYLETKNVGKLDGNMDILPKALGEKIPLLITGFSQQDLKWNARYGDGFIYFPQENRQQSRLITEWRENIPKDQQVNKPFMQSLYIDLQEDPYFKPQIIHLGFKTGIHFLKEHLNELQRIGVNHVALNLRFNTMDTKNTLKLLGEEILPCFHTS